MKKILLILFLFVSSFAQAQYDLTFNSGYGIKWNAGSYVKSTTGTLYLKGVELNFRNINDAIKFNVDDSGNVDITGEYRINGVSLIPIFKDYYDTVTTTLTNKSIDADSNTITNIKSAVFTIYANAHPSPADSTSYYIGQAILQPQTSDPIPRFTISFDCRITEASFKAYRFGATSAENITLYLQINGSDVYTLSSTWKWNVTNTNILTVTGLNIPVSAGDYVCLRLLTPNWTSNPTSYYFNGNIRVEN